MPVRFTGFSPFPPMKPVRFHQPELFDDAEGYCPGPVLYAYPLRWRRVCRRLLRLLASLLAVGIVVVAALRGCQ